MIPSQCHLWQNKNLSADDLFLKDSFTRLKSYTDESHLMRGLIQCIDCGQIYFYEFYEQIDWVEGNDPQYRTFIPLASEAEAEEISQLQPFELLHFFPRLQVDWPSTNEAPAVQWINNFPV